MNITLCRQRGFMTQELTKSKERVKRLGEVYTPKSLVLKMLRQIPPEIWSDPTKTFLDNSCGNGNFLVEIIKLKIKMGSSPIQALSSCFGVDIMSDNIEECKERLLLAVEKTSGLKREQQWNDIVNRNIVCHDALTYNYEFDGSLT